MLILYTSEDGKSQIQLRAKDQTVWLSQREMGELFDTSTDNISLHLKNIFEDEELRREATTEESSVVQVVENHLAVTGEVSVTVSVRCGTSLLGPSFPRRQEARSPQRMLARDWIPAFAAMTDCGWRFVGMTNGGWRVGPWIRLAPA